MKLEPEGKKRLESMKKTFAAGLPLAGLLAASAAVGAASQGCSIRQPMGRFPSEPPPEEWVLDGDIAPAEDDPAVSEEETPVLPATPNISNTSNNSPPPPSP